MDLEDPQEILKTLEASTRLLMETQANSGYGFDEALTAWHRCFPAICNREIDCSKLELAKTIQEFFRYKEGDSLGNNWFGRCGVVFGADLWCRGLKKPKGTDFIYAIGTGDALLIEPMRRAMVESGGNLFRIFRDKPVFFKRRLKSLENEQMRVNCWELWEMEKRAAFSVYATDGKPA